MRGGRFQTILAGTGRGKDDAVDWATAVHREKCELRLARIQNGKEPSHKNGPWPGQKKGQIMK